jgi:hypothetical protein
MEGECISLIELHLTSRIQFKPPKIAGNQEYRIKFQENIQYFFDNNRIISKANLDLIHKGWTINFADSRDYHDSLVPRIKALIMSLIKTDDFEQQFLRVLKTFYLNNSKRLYAVLLDFIVDNAMAPNSEFVKAKKDVFRHVNEQSD